MRKRSISPASLAIVALLATAWAIALSAGEGAADATNWSYSWEQGVTNGGGKWYCGLSEPSFVHPGNGVEVTSGYFKSVLVFSRVSLPYIRVPMQGAPFTCYINELGNGVRTSGPTVVALSGGGQRIETTYVTPQGGIWPQCGTDGYILRHDFYADGRYRPWLEIRGPGESYTHWYEPYFRLDLDIAGSALDYFDQWTTTWTNRTVENGYSDDGVHDSSGSEWRNRDSGGRTYRMAPYPGDNATVWAVVYPAGATNQDGAQHYPGEWDNNESIVGKDIVDYYGASKQYSSCHVGSTFPGSTIRPTGY